MKKLLFKVLLLGVVAFTSCAAEKCECTVNGTTQTFTEDDISNGSTVEEACDDSDEINRAAGTGSCQMV